MVESFVVFGAFALGFLARQVKLPPIIGYLAAGFILFALGYEKTPALEWLANAGVWLLLFSIGLKLNIKSLLSPMVWAGATIHMIVTVAVFGATFYGLAMIGFSSFAGLTPAMVILIAFALSFSSTIFAVKIQEEKGEVGARHARIAIGILIMQDVIAVAFIAASKGQTPSLWAVTLLALPLLRPLLLRIMVRVGHGELLILFGIMYVSAVAQAFEWVHLKPDLGALVAGAVLAGHPKADELSKCLLSFKDLLLVAFFLTVGMAGAPSLATVGLAALLVLAVPFKAALFFVILTRFKLRARTSLLGSLNLANYSEFGLIVAAAGAGAGWISHDWLLIVAVAVAMSFTLASPPNFAADRLWNRFKATLRSFQTTTRLPGDEPVTIGDAEVVVIGMGRLGVGAYDHVKEQMQVKVLGIDRDEKIVLQQIEAGRNVVLADAADPDAWEEGVTDGKVNTVLMAVPDFNAQIHAARRLAGLPIFTVASVQHEDEIPKLEEAGVDAVFSLYSEAGKGLANHALTRQTEHGES